MKSSGARHGLVTAGAPKNAVAFVAAADDLREKGITLRLIRNGHGSFSLRRPVSVIRYALRRVLPQADRGLVFWVLFSRRLDFIVVMCASTVYKTPRKHALARAIARLRGAQVVFLYVNCGYNLANLVESISRTPAGQRQVARARRLVARPDIVKAAISPQAARDVEEHFGLEGVRNIGFAPGIEAGEFRDELPEDPPLFINIGNYSHRKGTDLFIDVALRCLKRNPSLRFFWVGKNVPQPEDVPEIVERGVVGNFHFTRTRTPPFDLIRRSSGIVFTSRSEAFGLVVSETMAMRRRVFCFDGTGGSYQAGDVGHVFARFDTAAMAGAVLAHAARPAGERVDDAAFDRYRWEFGPRAFSARFADLLEDRAGRPPGACDKTASRSYRSSGNMARSAVLKKRLANDPANGI